MVAFADLREVEQRLEKKPVVIHQIVTLHSLRIPKYENAYNQPAAAAESVPLLHERPQPAAISQSVGRR